jgi:AraC-like DNA-binding protein
LVAGFPMVLIAFPDILYGLPRKISTRTNQHSESVVKEKKLFTDSEQNYFSELADRIKYYFENEKPFLNRDFSFDDLVSHINAPRHHIYFCLNSVIEKKFVALKNSYRISHAKMLLMEMNFDKYTIESVSLKCGFASRSNFYSVFKEETGITPTEFLAQNDRRETQLI